MLKVKNINFSYHHTPVLKHINFEIPLGHYAAVIGESGSGKSTLLKLIYGALDANAGEIWWKQQPILGPKHQLVIGQPFVKYVAQEFDLMPFTTVTDNIKKHLSRFYPELATSRTQELLQVVGLQDQALTKVKHLSGGQKQRVALARALAKTPELLLLDEPFSHIDNFKTFSLRRNIFSYLKKYDISCLVATHHKDDVLGFADRVLVLHQNTIVKNQTPEQLYQQPEMPSVAAFFEHYSIINQTIYYPHQIKVRPTAQHSAIVRQSFFMGAYWLVEASFQQQLIYLQHHQKLNPLTTIHITFEG